jgi:hypothetical protein
LYAKIRFKKVYQIMPLVTVLTAFFVFYNT